MNSGEPNLSLIQICERSVWERFNRVRRFAWTPFLFLWLFALLFLLVCDLRYHRFRTSLLNCSFVYTLSHTWNTSAPQRIYWELTFEPKLTIEFVTKSNPFWRVTLHGSQTEFKFTKKQQGQKLTASRRGATINGCFSARKGRHRRKQSDFHPFTHLGSLLLNTDHNVRLKSV